MSSQPTALITGASSGFGVSFARMLAQRGVSSVLVARRKENLEKLAAELNEEFKTDCRIAPTDLSDREAIAGLVDQVEGWGLEIETLINNAGYADYGPFAETGLDKHYDCVACNCEAVVALCRAFMPGMIGRRSGKILNVASTASWIPTPHMSLYGATKAFVLSLTEALRVETMGQGLKITALCPGPVATEFQKAAGMGEFLPNLPGLWLTSDQVAQTGLKALERNQPIIVPGVVNKAQVMLSRATPRKWLGAISGNTLKNLKT